MALQSLILPIISIFRSMGLTQARQGLTAITKDFKTFSKQIGMAAGSFAAFSALTTARQFTVDAVDATQKFERNILALNQVFEEAAPSLLAFTREVENYGLSQSQAAQASVFLGSVLKQYGFSTQEANASTQDLVKLAQDLATTFGYDVQEALLAITALFRGEYDPIEKFGVAMKQNEINAVRAARGLGHLTGAAEMQADAQIRLELLFERASDSMGAFERATNTLYGSQQLLNAALQNLMVSAGAPLQEPLAQVNNLFAELVADMGPQVTGIFEALGNAIDTVGPTFEKVARTVLNLIAPLEQLIGILNFALTPLIKGILNPALDILNSALGMLNDLFDALGAQLSIIELGFKKLAHSIEGTPLEPVVDAFGWLLENGFGIGAGLDFIGKQFQEAGAQAKVLAGIFPEVEQGNRQASAAMRVAAGATKRLNMALEEQEQRLKNAANASLEYLDYLESIGASVGRSEFYVPDTGTAVDYIGDFFGSIRDAVAKEQARLKLETMGASEGLIDAILGAQGWDQVFRRVIRDGEAGLRKLQAQFDKTAAGIEELAEATLEAEKAQKALRDAIQAAVDEQLAGLEQAAREARQTYEALKDAAEDFRRWSLDNVTSIQILPDVEEQLGKFESSIVSTIASMQSELQSAVRSGLIFESDFNSLRTWVATESAALEQIARDRDNLAKRYALSESLISEYQGALTSSLKLVGLFSKLKDETEEITVTEVSQGVVQLGSTLREFGITVEKSYTQTIEKVQDKSVGLLQGFRDMADKSRAFAENLRKLRDMGLDPMLFNQLVDAGVEAGGETAQALVDGGSATILEINDLFSEINRLGAELGMDVGNTMYEAGQDMTFGLLEGIQSEQEQLYEAAMNMAKTFSETFKNNLDIAIDAPVKQAQQVMEQAEEAVEQAKQVNVGALVQIENIIRAGLNALAGPLSTEFRQGITEKVAGLGALYKDVFSGAVTEIPGITGGLTSGELRAAAMATGGPQVTQYYNITVSGGNRLQQQQTVEEIRKFVDQNGNLSAWVNV